MEWPDDAPFYNFNEFSILSNAEPQFGVYGVFTADRQPLLIDAGEVMNDLIRIAQAADRDLNSRGAALFSFIVAPYEESMRLCAQLRAALLGEGKRRKQQAG
ncbi:MAG: hypothetical protein ACE14L_04025 [Terriglobales bacterium]